ncbi:hypothetical protein QBC43DRAFT_272187 [Cladorrhinum sp. PSN259]|nr:hypothetical protein QBC43DRAFT_272187 [Cladorrhinum sp. PSN259]
MAGTSPNPALDGESRAATVIAILSVVTILSTLVVSLRCYCRAVILGNFGLDDALIIPAQILTIATAIAIGLEAKYGLGRHIWTMPDEHYVPYMKSFYCSIIFYNVGVSLTKISILLQYKRIFPNTIPVLPTIIKVGLVILILWATTLCFLLPMVCMPVAAFWDPDVKGSCLDQATIWYVMAAFNVATDFAVFTIPIPIISSLHLPIRQRAMLFVVFTIGIFPCAISIYRIRTLHAAATSTDPTWDNVGAATFSFLELSVGVIAICLPPLRPMLIRFMPRVFGTLLNTGSRSGAGPTSGRRVSYAPFGDAGVDAGGGLPARRPSMFKGTLRESESTEGLRDVECGKFDAAELVHIPVQKRYSVSVVAGWEPQSVGELNPAGDEPGIKTMTVVTQEVSFAAMEEMERGEGGARKGAVTSECAPSRPTTCQRLQK